jgi:hypothetical protein
VVVVNTPAQAVPVREQNLDGGNIKVHEQGTANVNVTNTSLPVTPPSAVTSGSFAAQFAAPILGGDGGCCRQVGTQTATAISITMETGVFELVLSYQGNAVAQFYGPAGNGHSNVDLAFPRPIKFDQVNCVGVGGSCAVSTVGSQP